MPNAWEVKAHSDTVVDLWRNRRIYQYEAADTVEGAIEVARRRAKEGDTLLVTGDGPVRKFVHDGRKWKKP